MGLGSRVGSRVEVSGPGLEFFQLMWWVVGLMLEVFCFIEGLGFGVQGLHSPKLTSKPI